MMASRAGDQRAVSVVSTNPARCRDCYRCVRACPVKAVRVASGQAEVVPELCIECASCVRACPQRAKVIRDDLPAIKEALAARRKVVATVAPSLAAYFPVGGDPGRGLTSFQPMARALAQLGFAAAEETAVGAAMVGVAHGELLREHRTPRPIIASACPVVVNLIEQVYPDLIPHLAPLVSPMVAHARHLRQRFGPTAFTVFIGPCVAKKGEATDAAVAGAVDAVLTFDELAAWLADAGVALSESAGETEPAVPEQPPAQADAVARLFPLEGGLLGTARLDTDLLSTSVINGTGMEVCQNVLEGIRSHRLQAGMVELMACSGGCLNGPALMDQPSVALARQRVQGYAAQRGAPLAPPRAEWPSLARSYRNRSVPEPEFSEAQIVSILRQVGKYSAADELNCGSCGYATCREKAVATLRGMAEAAMCIPYMRSRAESLNNVVMDVTPNAILIVDGDLRVQDLSRSAERMFNCSRAQARGKPLAGLIPAVEDFWQVRDTGQPLLNKVVRLPVGLGGSEVIVEQSIVPVTGAEAAGTAQDRHLLLAILRDVTEREQQRRELALLRTETVRRTQEIATKQMRVAHEIAGLLGETTAETKVLLSQLARMLTAGDADNPRRAP